ncbi:class I SAM-dependent methyltransferase [uncultured Jannaschia sp.]|uniref:class I SAM-dependent methyltransferase n=1 Tax=uncultured Jannaschia sp. TaxID=293347 RepID=UPI00262D6554|nr:class I SAM-dependent methyltransferase [uncultured Jannaschia sp.]
MAVASCPACNGTRLAEIYALDAIPVQSCILLDTEAAARDFPRAPLSLVFCDACGFVFNPRFDGSLVDYASATEESQHFSGTFNAFARSLVDEIATRHDLAGKTTVEIGCGKGDFLHELVSVTGTAGLGIDPGFLLDRFVAADDHAIAFRREYFDPAALDMAPDFVVCRHTLEHVPDVGRFVGDVGAFAARKPGSVSFFETPNVERVLEEGAFWDIYYEHCSYFTLGSHARLFRRQGMAVDHARLAYDGQYILQYSSHGKDSGSVPAGQDDLERLRALAASFPGKVARVRHHWSDFVRQRHADGRRIAIWGGGSKGVSFLTSTDIAGAIAQVVDINPYKQGKYLPGTGHRVSAPDELLQAPPDTVIAMNPVYRNEIAARIAELGLDCELVAV